MALVHIASILGKCKHSEVSVHAQLANDVTVLQRTKPEERMIYIYDSDPLIQPPSVGLAPIKSYLIYLPNEREGIAWHFQPQAHIRLRMYLFCF